MQRSRLSRKIENQSKKSLLLSILGIIIVVTFVMKVGLPFLVNLTLIISGSKNNIETPKSKDAYISPPVLNDLPAATNSAKINITGTAMSKTLVKLYINDNLADETVTENNGSFLFEDIKLSKGDNKIKTKIEDNNGKSDYSTEMDVIFIDAPPTLTIDSPQDGKTFSKDDNPITVSGKTDTGVKLTINNLWTIVKNDGSFSHSLSLQSGSNEIKVTATDMAGNKTEVVKKATFNP